MPILVPQTDNGSQLRAQRDADPAGAAGARPEDEPGFGARSRRRPGAASRLCSREWCWTRSDGRISTTPRRDGTGLTDSEACEWHRTATPVSELAAGITCPIASTSSRRPRSCHPGRTGGGGVTGPIAKEEKETFLFFP